MIKPLVAPDGLAVGLQKGMNIDDVAKIMGPERCIGAVIKVAAGLHEPGAVTHQTGPQRI